MRKSAESTIVAGEMLRILNSKPVIKEDSKTVLQSPEYINRAVIEQVLGNTKATTVEGLVRELRGVMG
jgi:hypothetical protein